MIDDVKVFKSELKMYNKYKQLLASYSEQLELSYDNYKSPLAYERALVFEDDKFKVINILKSRGSMGNEAKIEIEYLTESKREKLRQSITFYKGKLEELDKTVKCLPEKLKTIVQRIYIQQQSYDKVAMNYGYTKSGLYKYVESELKKFFVKYFERG